SILSLRQGSAQISMGKDGKVKLGPCPNDAKDANGVYVVTASYTDMGANGMLGVAGVSKQIVLKSPGFLAQIKGSETVLASKLGQINGKGARHESKNIGYYGGIDTTVSWTVNAPAAGEFTIKVSQATPMDGKNEFKVMCNGKEVSAKVVKTSGWQNYKVVTLGKLPLKKGDNELIFKPVKITNGALANIRDIRLVK
ncbi:MAG: hypothetical protein NE330_04175, partial [Lentisphaeraceae bacterium]|nr:hypothetical protein [Lentisphaeraceae bacterium]